jgi:tetratricopeptide (TPR) repeat protein
MKRLAIILISAIGISQTSVAQQVRTTDAQIKLETKYLDGYTAQLSGDNEKAERIYLELLDKDAKNDGVLYQLARIYTNSKRNEKALESIKTAIAIDGKNVWYRSLQADILQKYGKNKEAADIYGQLVKLEPNNYDYYMQWAYLLGLSGDAKEAIKVFDALEKRTGIQEGIARQKHAMYIVLGDSKKAAKELSRLIESDPYNPNYYILLASFYQRSGEADKANDVYQQLLNVEPNNAQATLALAQSKKADNQDVAYINSLENVFKKKEIELDKKIIELIPFVTKVAEKGDKTLAEALLKNIKILDETHPNEAKISAIQADILYYTGQLSEAATLYKKTLSLNKKVYAVWDQLMNIQRETKDFDGLLKTSEEAMDLFPNQGGGYFMNALALGTKGKNDDAITNLQQAILMAGKNQRLRIEAQHELANAFYRQQKYADANTWNSKALVGGENAPAILERQGDILFHLQKNNEAIEFWKKAKEKGGASVILDQKINEQKVRD